METFHEVREVDTTSSLKLEVLYVTAQFVCALVM
jgi:hypothetical protein